MSWEKERAHRAKIAAGIVSPADYDKRKKTLSPAKVDARMAAALEELKSRAVDPPAEQAVDEEAVKSEEEERRNARLGDTLRRMKAPVLTQRQADGSIKFVHDKEVRERPFGSG